MTPVLQILSLNHPAPRVSFTQAEANTNDIVKVTSGASSVFQLKGIELPVQILRHYGYGKRSIQ